MNSSSIAAAARAVIAVLLAGAVSSGCYLAQAAVGHASIMAKRRPIDAVIAGGSTGRAVRDQLTAVLQIRDFAVRELKLPDNGSYRRYADIGRPFAVWNVVAAPEFSLQPLQWCFPVAGCVAYRGYFKERSAIAFAARLRKKGEDVMIGGVAAYSTLGHFDDPILSSMLGWSDVDLAAVIFHELTHQLLYVPGDSAFNEALATVVERDGIRRWLRAAGRDRDLVSYERQQGRHEQVLELLQRSRVELAALYATNIPADEMRDRKAAAFARLRRDYERLESGWGGKGPFDGWFSQPLNNAHLASIATYEQCVPGLAHEPKRIARAAHVPCGERQVLENSALEQGNDLAEHLAEALRVCLEDVERLVVDAGVRGGDVGGVADVGLADLDEPASPRQQIERRVDELAGERVENDVHAAPGRRGQERVAEGEIA